MIEIKFKEGTLQRHGTENTFRVSDGGATVHIIYEPGDCTRYDFYAIDIGYAYLICSEYLTFPDKVEKYLLVKGKEEHAVRAVFGDYNAVNPYTIWATISALIKLKEYV